MGSFDIYSNYKEDTAFSSIIFGADKPILEVEMNEMQQIIDNKIVKALRTILGKNSCLTPLGEGSISYDSSSKLVSVVDSIAVTNNGWVAIINNASVSVDANNKVVYLKVEEVIKSYDDTLTKYGNTNGTSILNMMKDNRSPVETTKRKVIIFTLSSGKSVPSDTETTRYIPIAVFDASANTITKTVTNRFDIMEKQLQNLTSVSTATVV